MYQILIVAYDCNPTRGSEAMFAFNWVNILSKYYKVTLITDIRHKKGLESSIHGIDLLCCKYMPERLSDILCKLHAHNIQYSLFIKKVKKIIDKNNADKFDLIHCLTPSGHYSCNDLYIYGKPIIAGPLGGGLKLPEGFENYKTLKYILRNNYYSRIRKNEKWNRYYNNCDLILIGTKYLLENLPEAIHYKTVELFDTVVDTDKFAPCSEKSLETVNIVYSGRLELSKGCMLLIKAYKLLLMEGYAQSRLIMLGDGSQYGKICKFIREEKLENYIYMPGRVTNSTVREILQAADIFCLPTLIEHGGTSILEAMSCELPVVTTNYGGPSISVTAECGIKIDAVNNNQYILSLKEALKYLIDNPEERRRMGRNGRIRVIAEYSYSSLEEKVVLLYENTFKKLDKCKLYNII
ncbi:glycosyltransferase involved in cell wall biosynthesis [Ruminiclostridium sufflavum DSM 19573]|uniref:Glycosyltransferase involved in cell wall biosynthesis n=2 Tax=Ruminiclostridium TaxID=1508657 RepID=A0A318YAL0_9FIRM|nr:glycosyltransferase involved in cell wall biosynthesis [Ruminiclostridium sufflavum DSM 19573]